MASMCWQLHTAAKISLSQRGLPWTHNPLPHSPIKPCADPQPSCKLTIWYLPCWVKGKGPTEVSSFENSHQETPSSEQSCLETTYKLCDSDGVTIPVKTIICASTHSPSWDNWLGASLPDSIFSDITLMAWKSALGKHTMDVSTHIRAFFYVPEDRGIKHVQSLPSQPEIQGNEFCLCPFLSRTGHGQSTRLQCSDKALVAVLSDLQGLCSGSDEKEAKGTMTFHGKSWIEQCWTSADKGASRGRLVILDATKWIPSQ